LPGEAAIKERVAAADAQPVRRYYERERPIELRPVESTATWARSIPTAASMSDSRDRPLPDEPAIHQCVLAYASDLTLLDAA